MLRAATVLLTLSVVLLAPFEPARLQSGGVDAIPFNTRAAGLVLAQLAVDSRGLVTEVTIIEDVAPFTEVVQNSVMRWSFAGAREGGQRVDSHVLVAGLFRPPMLLFPKPEIPRSLEAEPSEDIPFPTSVEIPPYPANRIGDAYVIVEGKVSESGSVSEARVMTPSSGFDDAALSALRGWRFRPAKRDGRAAPSSVYLIVLFRAPV